MTDQPTLRDRAIDAVAQALNAGRYWLPTEGRPVAADAVLALVAAELEASQRRAIRIQTLLDDTRDRARRDAIASRESERQLQQQIDDQAREIDRLQASDRRVRNLADQWFVSGPTPVHIQAGKELFAALEPTKEQP